MGDIRGFAAKDCQTNGMEDVTLDRVLDRVRNVDVDSMD